MSFMQPEVYFGPYFEVEADHGSTYIVPAELVPSAIKTYGRDLQDYVEGTVDEPDEEVVLSFGWLARMSAPGYMDCTDWSAHATEEEAHSHLAEMYGDDDEATTDDED